VVPSAVIAKARVPGSDSSQPCPLHPHPLTSPVGPKPSAYGAEPAVAAPLGRLAEPEHLPGLGGHADSAGVPAASRLTWLCGR
jgi:hypothetical protein